eukprot:8597278-Pyramimonas_sp.AAC.1
MLQQRLRTHHQLSPPQPQESEPQGSQSYQTDAWRWTPRRHGRTRRRAPRGARRHGTVSYTHLTLPTILL